ncbi:helix-turn-helix domain-containing protein [Nocardia wallacei]|uniref:helix-turn-helix domain-containing protein n=1 Tax=Nocardia wallacei TaxID=480035 RepID=UPI002456549D|nr:helix-turn-helix transcriptional regulator [Nocardia wallacei]
MSTDEKDPLQAVGAIVSAFRLNLGLSPAALARTAGVDVKTIRSLESGDRWPQDTTRHKLEVALHIEPGTIERWRDDPEARAQADDMLDAAVQVERSRRVSEDDSTGGSNLLDSLFGSESARHERRSSANTANPADSGLFPTRRSMSFDHGSFGFDLGKNAPPQAVAITLLMVLTHLSSVIEDYKRGDADEAKLLEIGEVTTRLGHDLIFELLGTDMVQNLYDTLDRALKERPATEGRPREDDPQGSVHEWPEQDDVVGALTHRLEATLISCSLVDSVRAVLYWDRNRGRVFVAYAVPTREGWDATGLVRRQLLDALLTFPLPVVLRLVRTIPVDVNGRVLTTKLPRISEKALSNPDWDPARDAP